MDFIIDAIVEWLKGLLVDGIMGNLDGLFDNVNQSVGEIATQVGTTPADWNAGVFSMIRQISETAILPIAGVILTFVMTYELIQMLIERNNLHEVDTWMFFKWVFKTFVAVMILTNTFNIVLAVFDVSQHVIQQSAGIIQNGTEITPDVLDSLRTELEAMELGPLFGLWLQSFLIQLTMIALNIVIFVIVYDLQNTLLYYSVNNTRYSQRPHLSVWLWYFYSFYCFWFIPPELFLDELYKLILWHDCQ